MKELSFLDSSENIKKVRKYFFVALGVLLIIDPFIHKHTEFPWEGAPFFYAVYGYAACVSLIFIAKALRFIVKRNKDYYSK
jgi:hypothetical protein